MYKLFAAAAIIVAALCLAWPAYASLTACAGIIFVLAEMLAGMAQDGAKAGHATATMFLIVLIIGLQVDIALSDGVLTHIGVSGGLKLVFIFAAVPLALGFIFRWIVDGQKKHVPEAA